MKRKRHDPWKLRPLADAIKPTPPRSRAYVIHLKRGAETTRCWRAIEFGMKATEVETEVTCKDCLLKLAKAR